MPCPISELGLEFDDDVCRILRICLRVATTVKGQDADASTPVGFVAVQRPHEGIFQSQEKLKGVVGSVLISLFQTVFTPT